MRPLPRWTLAVLLLLTTLAASTGVGLAVRQGTVRPLAATIDTAVAGQRFSLLDFELQSIFNAGLTRAGDWLSGRAPGPAEAERLLNRYFVLGGEIRAREDAGRSPDGLAGLRRERVRLENRVEAILEARVGAALREAGLTRALPLFSGHALLWPPVTVELGRPPHVLAVSPRDEIRLLRTVLLNPSLSDEAVAAIEAAVEADGRYSALVETIGGVAAFPALVRETRSYASAVATIAHEWVHHYLFFYPLGLAFSRNAETRTINETVANLVDGEIARLVFAASPGVDPPAVDPAADGDAAAAADAALRGLRLEVDALLAEGRVAEAEQRMEEARDALAAEGRVFRRLNQAFFAFNGQYADTPASSSPIGPLLRDLRDASPSLLAFVETVRGITSLAELQERLAAVESAAGQGPTEARGD